MNTEHRFAVTVNGDDAMHRTTFATIDEAEQFAAEQSIGHWLGHRVYGPSGKIRTYFAGAETGYLSGDGAWIRRENGAHNV